MRAIGLAAALVVGVSACGSDDEPANSTQRPAEKSTCPEAELTAEIPARDRQLVPFSPTVLGVETTYGNDEQLVRLVSGGYLDDLFESYDDLEEVGSATIRSSKATLLASDFLGTPVRAAVWREDVSAPCDAHALIALGYTETDFVAIYESIE